MFISVTSPVVLCMNNFVLNLFLFIINFFLADQGSGLFNKACLYFRLVCTSGWFVRINGITTAHTILTNVLKSLTFEAQILKIIKNVQPTPKN